MNSPTKANDALGFDVFSDLRPDKRLSKQSWGWWFETPSHLLLRHRNVRPWNWPIWAPKRMNGRYPYGNQVQSVPMSWRIHFVWRNCVSISQTPLTPWYRVRYFTSVAIHDKFLNQVLNAMIQIWVFFPVNCIGSQRNVRFTLPKRMLIELNLSEVQIAHWCIGIDAVTPHLTGTSFVGTDSPLCKWAWGKSRRWTSRTYPITGCFDPPFIYIAGHAARKLQRKRLSVCNIQLFIRAGKCFSVMTYL